MKKLIIIFTLILFFAEAQSKTMQEFFVSPFGNDNNPGTIEAPFGTIQKARDAVRKASSDIDGDIIVYLQGGTYQIDEPILFDHRDSGKVGHRIIYQAYRDEKPVISGGVSITGWEPHQNGIWKAPAKGLNFRQLYVNGKRAIRSRQPNSDNYYRLKAWDVAGRRIIIHGNQIADWKNFSKVEMVLQQYWAESYLRLKSYSLHGTVSGMDAYVTVQDDERDILFPRPYPQKANNQVFHFENAYEFLDMPGEWYLDLSADVVYYIPRSHENMDYIRVIAPNVETLLRIEGTLDKPVRDIVFQRITFAHSTWLYPGQNPYLNMQAGQYNVKADSINNQYVDRPPAAIEIMAAQDILFHRNIIRHAGATGIDLFYGTNNCQVIGNVIQDVSGNGISVGKFVRDKYIESHIPYNPEDKREICTDDVIRNNVIYQTGRDYYGACAIAAGYPSGLKIKHNIVRDNPYTGISVGYGWTHEPNAMRDNLIANNQISDVMNLLADGAGIYMLSMQPGTKIIGNHLYNIRRSQWAGEWPVAGIYLDEATGGTSQEPFIVKENFIQTSPRYNFHIIGKVMLDNDYFYIHQEGAQEVRDRAGLEPEYRDLEAIITKPAGARMQTRDIVMMTELKNEAEAIEKYEYYHSAEGIWPEVVHAAQASGFEKIKIYRFSNKLVMILTLPGDLDMDEVNRKYANSSIRIKEWGEFMSSFMQTPQGAEKGATWVPMEIIHDYENGVVK